MTTDHRQLLAIVPARAGSKGIHGKNMRMVGGRPLIAHTVSALELACVADRLLVSSDDDRALHWAAAHGYETHRRSEALAGDEATISEVAAHIADELDWQGDVGVFQPTSPLRSPDSIIQAVRRFHESPVDSLASCVRERHLFWLDEDGDLSHAKPLFAARVNRQYARSPVLRETGSIQLVRAEALRRGRQIVTGSHMLLEIDGDESLDIDTHQDLELARRRLEQGTVVFRLRANARVGSGHLFHCLQLAEELADQRLRFLLCDCDPFVALELDRRGYRHIDESVLSEDLAKLAGSERRVVVNDVLDTSEQEVLVERTAGYSVVNIEDLGPGARFADWVVNALYPAPASAPEHFSWGSAFATLREEFHDLPLKQIRDTPERVLITFGGTDPARLAARCSRLLVDRLPQELRVIVGPGAVASGFPERVVVLQQVQSMAAEMLEADVILTSAGRTVYEAAAAGTPVVVLAQNAREATHAHLSYDHGVVALGIGPLVDDDHIVCVVDRLLCDAHLRAELSQHLRRSVDTAGAARIAHRIRAILKGL